MKPRIYRSKGQWLCFTFDRGMRKDAAGGTAAEAYKNWHEAYLGGDAWRFRRMAQGWLVSDKVFRDAHRDYAQRHVCQTLGAARAACDVAHFASLGVRRG